MTHNEMYPEHAKLRVAVNDLHSQAVGEFLEWICNHYILAEYDDHDNLCAVSNRDILHEYFGIDPVVLENEKRAILEELRKNG